MLGFTFRSLRRFWDVLLTRVVETHKLEGVATRSVQDLRPPSKRPRPSRAPRLRQAGISEPSKLRLFGMGLRFKDFSGAVR